jgi:hypothetical protein
MALTSVISVDLVGQTQSITYYEGATQTDQITFSSNTITFTSTSGFSLSKSDCILYQSLFQTYFSSLLINFPNICKSANLIWPLCNFQISETYAGVTHLNYVQSSQGNTIYSINYVPIASAASFAARSTVTISLQEFFMMQIMLQQYTNQISLN